ncbi:MAG TPA: site-specific DNA-methyltransferase [Methermicoccus shengliensis]|uniref:Site-specific DNA-methyltransferase n=2 Tax=Methermicoccus shengliensis TaxID=660064 RepID=A0A832RXH5_9EURY|nr:site-specific DNA-methyltransferase [Methermicoccus shengliensis]HIH70196.1 site-specific DNA-methyltransferase [Methermicoccus shengliensis]
MTLMGELKELLKGDTRFVDAEGKLLKNKIVEHALKLDKELIKLLLKNERIKEHFFKDVDGILVFDKEKFMKFIDNKEFLPDSYTAFKNKIGLANENGKYIAKSKEVVLVWPYKDCVLEGGQEKPDEKRKEIFHNVILAPDEIDRLLEPKVFTNFKRIDKDGEHPLDGFRRDAEINRKRGLPEDTITDNLIIKGNNLLALHSLLKEFRGKVKLIYIDPPYNTGGDEFQYNDNFKHSTWLTFMKNRLEVAKELLSEDGSIWINIDDNELSYLQVLLDEIFGRENYISLVTVKRSASTGHKAINPGPINVTDYIIGYAKNKRMWKYHIQYVPRDYDKAYSLFIENYDEGVDKWKFIPISEALKKYGCTIYELIEKYPERIVRFAEPNYSGVGKETKRIIDLSKRIPNKIFIQKREGYPDIYLKNGQRILFYKDKVQKINGKITTVELLTNIWNDIPFQGIAKEGGIVLRKGKKPEKLLKRVIEMNTDAGDIVLDFFMGTGTTCAVAHKIGRQYVGIEQLDYGKNSALSRLKNVINGDQTGISKAVNWQGGGDFVYMELMKLNEPFIERIRDAETTEELLKIWEDMKHNGFLSYRVDPRLFDENIEEFKALNLDEQKKLLLEMLEYNDLYVNYSEIDDDIYNVSEMNKKLNKELYGGC